MFLFLLRCVNKSWEFSWQKWPPSPSHLYIPQWEENVGTIATNLHLWTQIDKEKTCWSRDFFAICTHCVIIGMLPWSFDEKRACSSKILILLVLNFFQRKWCLELCIIQLTAHIVCKFLLCWQSFITSISLFHCDSMPSVIQWQQSSVSIYCLSKNFNEKVKIASDKDYKKNKYSQFNFVRKRCRSL